MNKLGGTYLIAIILAISVAATLIGCEKAEAQKPAASKVLAAAPPPVLKKPLQTPPPAPQGWKAEWQKTLEAGRKEGTVAVYATLISPSVREQAPLFKKQFGIDIEVTTGRGADLSQKLLREKDAGISLADVVISGLNTFFGDVKRSGVTESMQNKLILPEVTNPKLWYTIDHLPWADDDKHIFSFYAYPNSDIAINTDLVKPGEIQSWQDLLNPKFKGKIIWSDPSIAGSGFNSFSTLLLNKATDENFYRQMVARQDITLTRDLRQIVEWLARGKYSVSIAAEGGPIAEFLNAGAHIANIGVKEGTYLSVDAGNVSIVAKAPHPNAAKVFVNWLLSKDGQDFAQKAMNYMSARNDIVAEGIVKPVQMRRPGEKYLIGANSVEKWVLEDQNRYMTLAKDIFGPVIGR